MKVSRSQFRDIIREFLEGDVRLEEEHAAPAVQDRVCVYSDDSAKMAKQQLFDLARKAQSLHDQLADDDDLPQWVQSDIAVAADKMSSVSEHMGYKLHRGDADSLGEGSIWDSDPNLEPGATYLAGAFPEGDESELEDEEVLTDGDGCEPPGGL